MMRLITIAVLLLTIAGCDKSGNDNSTAPVTPVTPVTPVDPVPPVDPVTPVDPNPEEGTILSTECEETTQVVEIADGNGGSTFERTEKSEECGYVPLSVEVVKRDGDYWKPVIIEVTGNDEWDFEVEAGHATRTETGIEITSDGSLGVWNATIAGEQYQYELVEAPVCLHEGAPGTRKTTCDGYLIGARASPMIYYGDEDTQIVTIEIGVVRTMAVCGYEEGCIIGSPVPADMNYTASSGTELDIVHNWIDTLNEFNVRTGVYIRFELTGYEWGNNWSDVYSFGPSREILERSDIVIGWGASGGNGGQAFMPVSIWPGMKTPVAVTTGLGGGVMQQGTATHEVGHAMGLGHGVWGDPDWNLETSLPLKWQGGSLFPRFGHGWMGKNGESVCGSNGSVMAYSNGFTWSNSLKTCEELGAGEYSLDNLWNGQAGSRQQSDEAYHLNRVRYSYSLIHNEHQVVRSAPQAQGKPEDPILMTD